jgi:outer membrane protein assembly factor BamD
MKLHLISHIHPTLAVILILFLMVGCSDYNKVLKSNDANLKYNTAQKLYEQGRYDRALPLYEELISLYRGTTKSEIIYLNYAFSNYYLENYILASYYFENFIKTYPTSEHAEQALFMSGYSDYMSSPAYSLDQEETYKAVDNLQLFMNTYPESELIDSCNVLVNELRAKLEKKAFENAFIYHQLGNYKSALIAFKDVLKDFPESNYKEDVLYWMVSTNFELAENSVVTKKKERYEDTVNAYYKFVDSYPESKWVSSAERYFKQALKYLESINS